MNKATSPCSYCSLPSILFCSEDMSDTAQAFEEDYEAMVHAQLIPLCKTGCYIYSVIITEQQEPTSLGFSFCITNLCMDVCDTQRERTVFLCFMAFMQVFLYYEFTSCISYFHSAQSCKSSRTRKVIGRSGKGLDQ